MFVTPLINITKMKNWVYRTIHAPSVNQREGDVKVEQCPICLATPIDLPYTTQCNHEMCYYCIKQNMMMDDHFPCPRCGQVVSEIKRS